MVEEVVQVSDDFRPEDVEIFRPYSDEIPWELLLEAAAEAEHVLDDPAPRGVFNNFGDNALGLEVNLFDFEGDLYGVDVRVQFVRRLRGEQTFDGVDALVAQLQADKHASMAALGHL